MTALAARADPASAPPGQVVSFAALPGFDGDDHRAALSAFRASCGALLSGEAAPRSARLAPPALMAVCRAARALDAATGDAEARRFFETHFVPRRLDATAFFTGYYEPVVDGSLVETRAFATPLLARPADLVGAEPGQALPGLDPALSAGRRLPDGGLAALPDRAAIEAGALGASAPPLVFVRDPVTAFFIHVQGSARVRLPDGSLRRLVYAGRNGHPYTSIGRVLVEQLHVPPAAMGMAELQAWIRANGQRPGEPGATLMSRNRSYIFFRFEDLPSEAGPIGGAGISLTPLRSLAVDRLVWPYGLPMFVDSLMPWESDAPTPFRRLMVAQDTGSAIVGAARSDIFFGTGAEAGRRAGPIRHPGTLFVLWPAAGNETAGKP